MNPPLRINGAMIRERIIELGPNAGTEFVMILWPQVTREMARLIATYPGEVVARGPDLLLPESWVALAKLTAGSDNDQT